MILKGRYKYNDNDYIGTDLMNNKVYHTIDTKQNDTPYTLILFHQKYKKAPKEKIIELFSRKVPYGIQLHDFIDKKKERNQHVAIFKKFLQNDLIFYNDDLQAITQFIFGANHQTAKETEMKIFSKNEFKTVFDINLIAQNIAASIYDGNSFVTEIVQKNTNKPMYIRFFYVSYIEEIIQTKSDQELEVFLKNNLTKSFPTLLKIQLPSQTIWGAFKI